MDIKHHQRRSNRTAGLRYGSMFAVWTAFTVCVFMTAPNVPNRLATVVAARVRHWRRQGLSHWTLAACHRDRLTFRGDVWPIPIAAAAEGAPVLGGRRLARIAQVCRRTCGVTSLLTPARTI